MWQFPQSSGSKWNPNVCVSTVCTGSVQNLWVRSDINAWNFKYNFKNVEKKHVSIDLRTHNVIIGQKLQLWFATPGLRLASSSKCLWPQCRSWGCVILHRNFGSDWKVWSFPVNCGIIFEHLSVSETAKITSDLKHFEGPFRQEAKQRIQVLQVAKVPKVRHLTFHRGFKTAQSDGFFGKFSCCSCTKS